MYMIVNYDYYILAKILIKFSCIVLNIFIVSECIVHFALIKYSKSFELANKNRDSNFVVNFETCSFFLI